MDSLTEYRAEVLAQAFSAKTLRAAARREGVRYAGEMKKLELARSLVKLGRTAAEIRTAAAG